jgi:hypothetical protein
LTRQGGNVALIDEPIITDPRIENIWSRYNWIGLSNHRYNIYLGVDTWMRYVFVVAEGEKVLHIRRGQALAKLFETR